MPTDEYTLAYKIGYQTAQLTMLRNIFAGNNLTLSYHEVKHCRAILGLSTNPALDTVQPLDPEPAELENEEELDLDPQF